MVANQGWNRYLAVTPANATALPVPMGVITHHRPGGIYVGGAGTIACGAEDGLVTLFVAAVAGTIYPISPWSINATGTTATNLVALYRV